MENFKKITSRGLMIQIVYECKSVVHALWECPVHVYDSIGSIWLVKSET